MKHRILFTACSAVVMMATGAVHATIIPVPDGSFESGTPGAVLAGVNNGGGTVPNPSSGPNTISGWNVSLTPYSGGSPAGTYSSNGWDSVAYTNIGLWTGSTGGPWWYGTPEDGSQYMLFTPGEPYDNGSVPNYTAIPGLTFTITTTGITALVVPGTTYSASAFGQNVNKTNWGGTNGVPFSPQGADMTMNILVNGTVVASQTTPGSSFTEDLTGNGNNWVPFGASWTAPSGDAGDSIQLQVVASNFEDGQYGGGQQWTAPLMGVDNVTLNATAAVPEPAALSALATGIVGLTVRRRRRA